MPNPTPLREVIARTLWRRHADRIINPEAPAHLREPHDYRGWADAPARARTQAYEHADAILTALQEWEPSEAVVDAGLSGFYPLSEFTGRGPLTNGKRMIGALRALLSAAAREGRE